MLILFSNGIYSVNFIEDFDFFWDLWNDFVFVVVDIFVLKVNYIEYLNCFLWILKDLVKDINKKIF